MVAFTVDGHTIQAEPGTSLLKACLDNGIFIPNLCFLRDQAQPEASCRLCFVAVEGKTGPTASCTEVVREGLVVRTDTEEVRRLQRSALKLLLSVHDVDCAHCPANKKCEIQNLAKFLKVGLKPKGLNRHLKEPALDETHPHLFFHRNRCVLCGRCIRVCANHHSKPGLTFAGRGFDTVVAYFGHPRQEDTNCLDCLACVDICPVGALIPKNQGESSSNQAS